MSIQACAACGSQNPSGALFCGRCGTRLGRECPSCGVVVADAAFCTSCGAALEEREEVGPAGEERKFVSVLFADLVGFTGRAEGLDPEDVRRLLAPYYARLREELERFGGTVEKFIGDAVVAFFGAPKAHEDDPERAVRAALAAREAIAELNAADPSLGLQVRIGVTTGEAVVSVHARPETGDQLGAGDVVNTAARLQTRAPAGGILVDEATYRATEQTIEYRGRGLVEAKGKSTPVSAWEVVAPRARLGVDIAFRGRARLVGRREELDLLLGALARVRRERQPQLVTLVGVPGIGKSRLVYELFASIEANPELLVTWRQGRSLPYGEGVSFWALGEMVKAQAGILESDAADVATEKLAHAVRALVEEAEAQRLVTHLRPLTGLGSAVEGHKAREEAFDAWRRFLEALAEQRPLVLVFEDVHWADDGLLDFVDELVDWTVGVPLLVVATARPELLERRPAWGGGKRNAVTISLPPLSDEETAELLGLLLPAPEAELVARAGGNPLYAEEYARMLAQADGRELPLPESVQGIIAARIDRLPPEEKTIVHDASIVGKVFWTGALEAISGLARALLEERLRTLERKEFIRRERRSSVEAEAAYVFRHVLVGDVAYGQIPRAGRAEKHRLAAGWLEGLAADRSEDVAEMLAHHYGRALEYARAAGQPTDSLAERTRVALREAGDRASALFGFAAAARYFGAALELWPPGDPERPRILFDYGRALYYSSDSGADVLTQAAEELLDLGEREAAAEAQTIVGELAWIEGNRDVAFEQFEGAAALVEDAPASRAKAYVLGTIARFLMAADRTNEAIRIGRDAYRMAEELGLDELQAHVLNSIGVAKVGGGDVSGLEDVEQAIALGEQMNWPDTWRAYNNLASTYAALGELDRAFELFRAARNGAERLGRKRAVRWFDTENMYEAYWRGRWEEASELARAFVAEAERGEPHIRVVDAHVVAGAIALARDRCAEALEDSEQALAFARRVRDPQTLFPALAFRARALAAAGESEAGAEAATELMRWWRNSPSTFATFWTADLAAALVMLGRGPELPQGAARAALKTPWLEAALALAAGDPKRAAQTYARIGSLPDEAYARLRAAEALAGVGRRAEAEAEVETALEFFHAVGAEAYARDADRLRAVRRA